MAWRKRGGDTYDDLAPAARAALDAFLGEALDEPDVVRVVLSPGEEGYLVVQVVLRELSDAAVALLDRAQERRHPEAKLAFLGIKLRQDGSAPGEDGGGTRFVRE